MESPQSPHSSSLWVFALRYSRVLSSSPISALKSLGYYTSSTVLLLGSSQDAIEPSGVLFHLSQFFGPPSTRVRARLSLRDTAFDCVANGFV